MSLDTNEKRRARRKAAREFVPERPTIGDAMTKQTRGTATPGPWRIQRECWPVDEHAYDLLIESATDEETQGVHTGRKIAKIPRSLGMEVSVANARLIAAAPELLAALRALTAMFDSEGVLHIPDDIAIRWDDARAAIKAAEGGE